MQNVDKKTQRLILLLYACNWHTTKIAKHFKIKERKIHRFLLTVRGHLVRPSKRLEWPTQGDFQSVSLGYADFRIDTSQDHWKRPCRNFRFIRVSDEGRIEVGWTGTWKVPKMHIEKGIDRFIGINIRGENNVRQKVSVRTIYRDVLNNSDADALWVHVYGCHMLRKILAHKLMNDFSFFTSDDRPICGPSGATTTPILQGNKQ